MNPTVETIAATLRESGMDWLASEIEAAIRQGDPPWFSVQENPDEQIVSLSSPQPLSDTDELKLAIAAIHAHLLDLRRVWEEANRLLKHLIEGAPSSEQSELFQGGPLKILVQESRNARPSRTRGCIARPPRRSSSSQTADRPKPTRPYPKFA